YTTLFRSIVSSVSPSLKYSCFGSLLRFWKGKIASIARFAGAELTERRVRTMYVATVKARTRRAITKTAVFQDRFLSARTSTGSCRVLRAGVLTAGVLT